jgi:hypothetical protein
MLQQICKPNLAHLQILVNGQICCIFKIHTGHIIVLQEALNGATYLQDQNLAYLQSHTGHIIVL